MESSAPHCTAQAATQEAKDASAGALLASQMHMRRPAKSSFGDLLSALRQRSYDLNSYAPFIQKSTATKTQCMNHAFQEQPGNSFSPQGCVLSVHSPFRDSSIQIHTIRATAKSTSTPDINSNRKRATVFFLIMER